MNRSETIDKLASALVKAQSEMTAIPKTKKVLVKSDKGSYEFWYAPLDEVVTAMRPILAAHGLAFSQGVVGDFLETTILHESGEYWTDSMPIKGGGTAQSYGSELTYKRRYALSARFGLVTEDDDDAGRAEEEKPKRKSAKVTAEFYDALPAEKQVAMKEDAKKVEADFYTKGIRQAIVRYKEVTGELDGDGKTAFWFCLDSKVRSAIKSYGESHPEAA